MTAENMSFDSVKRSLLSGNYNSVNILHGEEEYYIDELVKLFEQIIPLDDRDFALTNIYAPEVSNPQAIIDICRQVPMMTDHQVVIVREAQNVSGTFLDKLSNYVSSPTLSTILVISSRGEKLKGKTLLKTAQKNGAFIFETPKIWPNQIPGLIAGYIKSKGLNADIKAVEMLTDYVGTNLSRLYNEIDKLANILSKGATVTPEAIERNIGVSKDYNNFELIDAVAARDFGKMIRICQYFESNPKDNPYPVTVTNLFGFFADVLQGFYTKDRSERGIQQALELRNSFAVRRIMTGMRNYNAYQTIEIIDAIRRYDAMSKGSGSRQDPYKMLSDLMYHIISAPGRLPV